MLRFAGVCRSRPDQTGESAAESVVETEVIEVGGLDGEKEEENEAEIIISSDMSDDETP